MYADAKLYNRIIPCRSDQFSWPIDCHIWLGQISISGCGGRESEDSVQPLQQQPCKESNVTTASVVRSTLIRGRGFKNRSSRVVVTFIATPSFLLLPICDRLAPLHLHFTCWRLSSPTSSLPAPSSLLVT